MAAEGPALLNHNESRAIRGSKRPRPPRTENGRTHVGFSRGMTMDIERED